MDWLTGVRSKFQLSSAHEKFAVCNGLMVVLIWVYAARLCIIYSNYCQKIDHRFLAIFFHISSRGAFLWEDPDQDFLICSVPFERIHVHISDLSNPLWTRIHQIPDLIWVIWQRIIGIRPVPLDKGSKIYHCIQRFSLWIATYFTSGPFPSLFQRFTVDSNVVVSRGI